MARTLHILLVEDHEALQETTITTLKLMGHTVDLAETGQAALLSFSRPYDLIIMDVQLPDANGLELTKVFRSKDKETTILAFTNATNIEELDRKCLEAGMNARLPKPFTPDEFEEVMSRVTA